MKAAGLPQLSCPDQIRAANEATVARMQTYTSECDITSSDVDVSSGVFALTCEGRQKLCQSPCQSVEVLNEAQWRIQTKSRRKKLKVKSLRRRRDEVAVQYEYSDVELHANEFTMAHPRKPPGLLSSNVVDTCEFSEAFCMSDKKNVDTSSDEGPDDNFLQFPTETKDFGETEIHATDVDNRDDGDDFKQYEDGEDVLLLEAIQRAEAALRDFVLPGETVSPDVVAPEFNVDFYLEPDHLQFMPSDDDGEQYECGDIETQVFDVDTSDFSPHQFINDDGEQYENGNIVNQFIAPDEAREPMRSDDTSFKNEKHVTFVEPHANDAMAPEDTGAFHGFSPKHIELICSIATRVATSVSETAFVKISLVMDEKFVNLKKYVQEHDFDLYQTIMEVREDFKEFEDQFDALRSQRIADIDMDSS